MTLPAAVTAADLRRSCRDRSMVNHDTYRAIYARLGAAMRDFARSHPRQTIYVYTVPPVVFGRPLYKLEHAVRYVMEKAARAGFAVRHGGGGDVIIDWTPAPVRRKPAEVRRGEVASRNERRRRAEARSTARALRSGGDKDAAQARVLARGRRESEGATRVLEETHGARETAENLNRQLEALLRSVQADEPPPPSSATTPARKKASLS